MELPLHSLNDKNLSHTLCANSFNSKHRGNSLMIADNKFTNSLILEKIIYAIYRT